MPGPSTCSTAGARARSHAAKPLPPQWAGLKFFNVYGPNELHKGGQMSVVPQFHRQIAGDRRRAPVQVLPPRLSPTAASCATSSMSTIPSRSCCGCYDNPRRQRPVQRRHRRRPAASPIWPARSSPRWAARRRSSTSTCRRRCATAISISPRPGWTGCAPPDFDRPFTALEQGVARLCRPVPLAGGPVPLSRRWPYPDIDPVASISASIPLFGLRIGPIADPLVRPGLYHRPAAGLALYGLAGAAGALQSAGQPADRDRPGRFPVLGDGRRADRRAARHRAVLSAAAYISPTRSTSCSIWQGGMSFHGGMLGVTTAMILFARQRRIPLFRLSDLVAAPRRSACSSAGSPISSTASCGAGRPTCPGHGLSRPGGPVPRHPSQLYEAASEGLLLFVLLAMLAQRPAIRGRARPADRAVPDRLCHRPHRSASCSASPIPIWASSSAPISMGQVLSLPDAARRAGDRWLALSRPAERPRLSVSPLAAHASAERIARQAARSPSPTIWRRR